MALYGRASGGRSTRAAAAPDAAQRARAPVHPRRQSRHATSAASTASPTSARPSDYAAARAGAGLRGAAPLRRAAAPHRRAGADRGGAGLLRADQRVDRRRRSTCPITPTMLRIHRAEQALFSYLQYRACPAAFAGKALGIMGAAVEGHLDSGHAVGSVSGHLYRSMPRVVKAAIRRAAGGVDHHRLRAEVPAHPAARAERARHHLHGLAESLDLPAAARTPCTPIATLLLRVAGDGSARGVDALPAAVRDAIAGRITAQPARAARPRPAARAHVRRASGRRSALVTTWTGGSCGIALGRAARRRCPPTTRVMELGYQSTEFRGTHGARPDTPGRTAATAPSPSSSSSEEDAWDAGRA